MSYGVSDHKPVLGSFSLEVSDNSLWTERAWKISLPADFLPLSYSWGSVSTHQWYIFLLWVCGAQMRVHVWPTPSKKTSCHPRGIGLACTRCWSRLYLHPSIKTSSYPSIHLVLVWIEFLGLVFLQVGFKSASDYETFVWVREDELPEVNEVIQVQHQWGTCHGVQQTYASLACVSAAAADFHRSWWDPSAGWRVRFRLLQHQPPKHHRPQHQLSSERLLSGFTDISYSLHKYLQPLDFSLYKIKYRAFKYVLSFYWSRWTLIRLISKFVIAAREERGRVFNVLPWSSRFWSPSVLSWRAWFLRTSTGSNEKSHTAGSYSWSVPSACLYTCDS